MKRTFTGKNRIFLAVSGIIIAVALIMQICGAGINLGIDFTGGSLLTYSVGENYDSDDVAIILEEAGYTDYQITKTEPSEASMNLRAEMAEEAAEEATEETTEEATEETAEEATEETAEEATEETTEEATEETEVAEAGLLDTDKSGIEADGLTDLQIRLDLANETEGLDTAVTESIAASCEGAEFVSFDPVTNIMVNEMDLDSAYAGGYVAEYAYAAEIDAEAVAASVETALTGKGFSVNAVSVTAITDEETAAVTGIRVLVSIDDQTTQVRALIETEMAKKYPDFVFVTIDHVSATAGKDLIGNAVKALLIAFVCMLVYIAIRFDFYSGVVALGALIHDVLIMCAFMVFFSGLFQANSPFIAAVLTIVGYSINNTIIVFDRIRENAKKPGQTSMKKIDIVEMSVKQTLSRTANTTITTMITLVCLYIFGVDSIREFAFPLIVGMIAGTYSSILLSGQVWAAWVDHRNAKKAAADKA